MKRCLYLLIAGLLMFALPSIATTTGSVETNVVEVDIGYDVCEQAYDFRLTLSEQYSPTSEVKRSDGKTETDSYLFTNSFTVGESMTLVDNLTGFQPHLTGLNATPLKYSYRKARDGLTCTA